MKIKKIVSKLKKKKILKNLAIFVAGGFAMMLILILLFSGFKNASSGIQSKRIITAPALEKSGWTGSSDSRNSYSDSSSDTESSSRLVIKTGSLNMVVKNVENSARNIIKYAENKNGWIVSSSITEQKEIPNARITVRVPEKTFEQAMTYFRGLAEKISYEGSQGRDITEEYTDLQAQLINLEATETQLLKIMERSGTIPEVLSVQRELTRTRDQIERMKGRIQYLKNSAEMATITINLALSEDLLPIPPGEKWRPKYVFHQALNSLTSSLRNISYILIWIGVYLTLFIPLIIAVLIFIKFKKKRKK